MKDALGFQPLYKQLYNHMLSRISEGHWKPLEALPSEYALANELGVSQGTVRKALSILEAENVIHRRQGKGTFVSQHTTEGSIFRFFRLTKKGGQRLTPKSQIKSISKRRASQAEQGALDLSDGDQVIEIDRTRIVDDCPCVAETLVLPDGIFAGLDKAVITAESLYPFYQSQYGIHIVSVEEQLQAVVAAQDVADKLGVATGTPLLKIARIALTIDRRPVELRISYTKTNDYVYSIGIS